MSCAFLWLVVEVLVLGDGLALMGFGAFGAGSLPLGGAWAWACRVFLVFGNCESGSGVLLGTQDGLGSAEVAWSQGCGAPVGVGWSVTALAWVSDPCWLAPLWGWLATRLRCCSVQEYF